MSSRHHLPQAIALFFLIGGMSLTLIPAQDSAPGNEPMTDVQFPNTPVPIILLEYERLTGKRVIRDSSIQDQSLSIQTSGKMTYSDAAEFIEKSFLLNGYAILSTEKEDEIKIVSYTSKFPSSEGLPVVTTPFQIPESDQVITYIMPLSYLSPEAAAELFESIVELHSYGKITPLQNASAVVITESSNVIRRLVELRDHLDVTPIKTMDRSFQLERADAEAVVEALIDILELDQESPPGGSSQGANAQNPASMQAAGGALIPSQRGSASFAKPTSPKPRVRAIPRANRVLVVASPSDMDYVANIIAHLDAPVENSTYLRRKLKYIQVADVLQIAGDVIQRGLGSEDAGQSQLSGQQNNRQQNQFGNQNNGNNNETGLGGNSSGSGSSGNLGNAGSDQAAPPLSVVIDKTLLVADNAQNMLIASGPPEHLLLIEELLDTMDVRPSQIQISAVIAQLNLSDNFNFGFDFLRTLDNLGNGATPAIAGSLGSTGGGLLDVSSLTDVNNLIPAAQGLTLYGQINNHTDAVFTALENTNRFEVLQRPTVYTINNRQATIETGQRIAVPRSTLSSVDIDQGNNNQVVTANIDFEDVVLRIDVLPLINADGEITLQIQQRNDDIIGSTLIGNDEIPTIGTQVIGTTVMVPDGGTVLLGGLISQDDQKSESGVPLFANLPLVGRVFGNTSDSLLRQELLIFIQPKIIRSEHDRVYADQDMQDRTKVATSAMEFANDESDNLDVFETPEFNSAEKRVHFFRDLFKKQKKKPTVRAVPVGE
ncbi:MAG: secretin N-terminal domain-containing protein [Verrucomicrobiales bacterium]|nr:secretin N-terminal domain-containing protein [Verrucomicrobiales bacterium]